MAHTPVAPVFILTWPLYTGEWFSRYFAAVVPLMFVTLFYAIRSGVMKNEAFVNSMSRSGDASSAMKGKIGAIAELAQEMMAGLNVSIISMMEPGHLRGLLRGESVKATKITP